MSTTRCRWCRQAIELTADVADLQLCEACLQKRWRAGPQLAPPQMLATEPAPPATDEREHFERLLQRRSKRLLEFIDLKAPPVVVAREVLNVWRAAWGYAPEVLGHLLASVEQDDARRRAWRCTVCGKRGARPPAEACAACEAAAKKDMSEPDD